MANEDFDIYVRSENYGNYSNVYSKRIKSLKPRETKRVDITLPTIYYVYGRIVNNGSGSNVASVYIGFGNKKTTSVNSNIHGAFSLYAPENYSGSATLYVTTMDGDVVTKEIYLGVGNVNVGDIVISSDFGSGGLMDVQLSDGTTRTIEIEDPSENYEAGGVWIMDDRLIVSSFDDSEYDKFVLQIEGYDASKNSFEDVDVWVSDGFQHLDCIGNASVTISKKSGKYIFGLSGTGTYYNDDVYDDKAIFSANNVAIDLFMIMNSYRNVNPMDLGAPSFTPLLSSNAPLVQVISQSKYGTGVNIYYNGSKSDFEKLKALADKSGIAKVDENDEGGYFEIMYYTDGKAITLEYNPYGEIVDSGFDPYEDEPQIMVTAMENVPEYIYYSANTRSSSNSLMKVPRRKLPVIDSSH